MKSYLKMDFYRMLTSKYFGIGILGVVGVYGLSLMQLKSQDVYLLNYYIKLDIENPIIRINTAFKGCSSLEKISVLPRIYHN